MSVISKRVAEAICAAENRKITVAEDLVQYVEDHVRFDIVFMLEDKETGYQLGLDFEGIQTYAEEENWCKWPCDAWAKIHNHMNKDISYDIALFYKNEDNYEFDQSYYNDLVKIKEKPMSTIFENPNYEEVIVKESDNGITLFDDHSQLFLVVDSNNYFVGHYMTRTTVNCEMDCDPVLEGDYVLGEDKNVDKAALEFVKDKGIKEIKCFPTEEKPVEYKATLDIIREAVRQSNCEPGTPRYAWLKGMEKFILEAEPANLTLISGKILSDVDAGDIDLCDNVWSDVAQRIVDIIEGPTYTINEDSIPF